MPRQNEAVGRLFDELATLTELDEGDPQSFRVRAYTNAARAIRGLGQDVAALSAAELGRQKGIGASTAKKIREFVDTGSIANLETLRERYPASQRELLRIPGVGAKTVRLLDEVLGIRDVDALRAALEGDALAELPGMGEKTIANLRDAIGRLGLHGKERRTPIGSAMSVGEAVVSALTSVTGVEEIAYAGSLRRFRETIGDLDILVASRDPGPVTDAFVALPDVADVLASGETKTSVVTHEGLQIDLRVVPPDSWGAALVYFTGSKAHNIRLRERAIAREMTLNEYALVRTDGSDEVVASRTEADIYEALDLPWIPPELREDDGEIEAASSGDSPPSLVVEDLRGDLHDHSDYSGDGRSTLEEMVAAAASRGHEYFAITDHAENLTINGVNRAGMKAQRARVRELDEEYGDLHLMHGVELNIGIDGSLDYDEEFLLGFDWCVASVHSHFRRPETEQTARILAAMRHPAVNAIGHLTGRYIGTRPGIDLDLAAVLDTAAETRTLIEINSSLERLDASVEVIREGKKRGVTFVISTDAHEVRELDRHRHGIRHARRAGLTTEDVANTWPREDFLAFVATKRQV